MRTKNENKARQILIENNWFRDYYYIKQVIKSCCDTNLIGDRDYMGISAVQKARRWGFNNLDRKKEDLCKKYPKVKKHIEEIYYSYMDDLRNIYENTFEYVCDTIK